MPKRGENIHKRKDGRWEGRYKKETTLSGKSKYGSVYGKTYGEVKIKLREISQKEIPCVPSRKVEWRFKDVLLMWKETNRLKHKGATEAKYEYLIEKHIIPNLGDYDVSNINTLLLNEFVEQKLQNGRLDHKGGLSAAYVRSMMIIITSALQYAVNEQMCTPLKTPAHKPTTEKKDLLILTPEEQEVLEAFLLNEIDETKLGVLLSLHSGMRIGEICALRWEDIDLKSGVIHVRYTVARVKNERTGGTSLIIDKPKTKASLRDIPIQSKLIPILSYMKSRATSAYVVSNSASFISPRTYEYRYHRLLKQCSLQSINYHALRHTFATRCIQAGVDNKTLSEILGHANVSITLNTYVHPSMDMKRAQIEKLDAFSA